MITHCSQIDVHVDQYTQMLSVSYKMRIYIDK